MPSLPGVWRFESLRRQDEPILTTETHLVVADGEMWEVHPGRQYYEDEPGPEEPYRLTWHGLLDGAVGRLEVLSNHGPNQCGLVRLDGERLSIRWNGVAGTFPESFGDEWGRLAVYVREDNELLARRLRERPARVTRQHLTHPVLGALGFDQNLDWWEGQVAFGGAQISVYVSAGGPETFDAAAAILGRADCHRLRAFAAQELLALHNESWLQDGDVALSVDEFVARLQPVSFCVEGGDGASFDFDDGDLFWGHAVVVEVDRDGQPISAEMH